MSKEKDKRITRELLIQTSNSVTKSKTSEGHVIRNWKIYIEQLPKTNSRGEEVNLSMNYVESVTYKLHESFANSVRGI
jgi:transcription initiation factor IIF auxiliary subunit